MKGTHHQGAHHIVEPIVYIKTIMALIVLMALTIFFGRIALPDAHIFGLTIDGSYFNNALALGIAITKGLLVISFFMGVKRASDLVKLWAMLGFIWFCLMFIILNDYGTRRFEPVQSWDKSDPGSGMGRVMDRNGKDSDTMVHTRP